MMSQKNFEYAFESPRTTEEIYTLLLQIDQWWKGFYNETITGESEQIGDEFEFLAGGGAHYGKHKLVELVPQQKLVWLVTDSKLTFIAKTDEWVGTKLRFDIIDNGNFRKVTFTHEGLIPQFECYGNCSVAWTQYMEQLEDNLK